MTSHSDNDEFLKNISDKESGSDEENNFNYESSSDEESSSDVKFSSDEEYIFSSDEEYRSSLVKDTTRKYAKYIESDMFPPISEWGKQSHLKFPRLLIEQIEKATVEIISKSDAIHLISAKLVRETEKALVDAQQEVASIAAVVKTSKKCDNIAKVLYDKRRKLKIAEQAVKKAKIASLNNWHTIWTAEKKLKAIRAFLNEHDFDDN